MEQFNRGQGYMKSSKTMNRRDLLKRGAAGGIGLALAPLVAGPARAEKPYGPFKMGIQSYSLRGYKLDQALEQTKGLGLHYWEAYPGHIPLTTESAQVAEIQGKLKAAGVRLLAHGVNGFGADQAANRRIFEAAKAMGIETLSADPTAQALDPLEQLVEEFGINIAIHNHGPGSRYDKLQQVVDAVKGRHKRIGACADLGHFLRSRENPVRVLEALGDRLFGVHLKDVRDATTFTVLGKGDMDLPAVLKTLRALKFKHVLALEYEENPENPIPDIQECLPAVRSALEKI
jgi:inosose dehydratase